MPTQQLCRATQWQKPDLADANTVMDLVLSAVRHPEDLQKVYKASTSPKS